MKKTKQKKKTTTKKLNESKKQKLKQKQNMIELAIIMLKKCLAIITALYNLFMYKSRRLLLQKGDFFF